MAKMVISLRPLVVQQALDEFERQKAVQAAINASNRAGRKISGKEAKLIKALLK